MPFTPPDDLVELRAAQSAWLADLAGRRPRSPEERASVFAAPPRGTVEQRWAIYADGYAARIAEALEDDFPAVRRILGAGPLHSLAGRYVSACLPCSYDLGRAGDRLAEFLEADPLARDLPFLPDLARLEWAVREAFVAADAVALAWSDVAMLSPEIVADRPLALVPGAALVASDWPIHDLWACRHTPDEEVSIALEGRPQTVIVLRRGLAVHCRLAEHREARVFAAARAGLTLAGTADEAGESEAPHLVEAFRALVEEGLFMKEDEECRFRSRDDC